MRKVPLAESLRIIGQGTLNWFTQRPVVVSFEVTDSCNCHCRHCDHGGLKDDAGIMQPADYRRAMQVLRPCLVQVSGGEPLLRDDLESVVRNIKQPNRLPYIILVSNWALMTEERYLRLREAGVDHYSVSLDFPDRRHDEFRRYPGLYDHLDDLVPRLARLGYDDIVLNTCIHSENAGEINAAADQARRWGVNICYSAYSARRTGCRDLFPAGEEQLGVLRAQLARVLSRRNDENFIVSAPTTLRHTREYFENRGMGGCKAGLRFLVVTSRGELQPCSMQFTRYRLEDQARMVEEFTRNNKCDECYVAIRSNLDKSFPQILGENVARYFSFGRSNGASGGGGC
jgi:MoaA/NifB/PqqE/SkfB family radical SAM enzyme